MQEKRNTERFDYPMRIEFEVGNNHSAEIRKGVVIDISSRGICLYGFSPLQQGQHIRVRSGLPVGPRQAVLRWMRQEDEGMYRLGLLFLAT